MDLSHDPIAALSEIRGFLEAMPIDADHELVKDGTVYGYWLPIEYLDGLLAIRRRLKGVSHDYGRTKQEALQTLQEFLRWRGYERAIVRQDGDLQLLTLNEHQARLRLFEIFELAVGQGAEAKKQIASELGLMTEELDAVVQFALTFWTQGKSEIGTAKAAKAAKTKAEKGKTKQLDLKVENGDAPA